MSLNQFQNYQLCIREYIRKNKLDPDKIDPFDYGLVQESDGSVNIKHWKLKIPEPKISDLKKISPEEIKKSKKMRTGVVIDVVSSLDQENSYIEGSTCICLSDLYVYLGGKWTKF